MTNNVPIKMTQFTIKLFQKKFKGLAARGVFVRLFPPFGLKNSCFLTNKLLGLAPFAGGMEFATQISPLLNFMLML